MSQLKYLTDDIDELDAVEHDLETNGVPRSHIHILSENTTALALHNLPTMSEWSRRDILHFGTLGAATGGVLSAFILVGAILYGVTDPSAWVVLAFISAITMGFCTWEGGLVGMNKLNHSFEKYRDAIASGQYLLIVNPENTREEKVARYAVESHPVLRAVD